MMKSLSIVVVGAFAFYSTALGSTQVQFTNQELNAAFTLIRPELNTVVINQREGVFTPAPALRFFGMDEQRFDLKLNTISELVGTEFDGLQAKMPTIQFQNGTLVLALPIQDHDKVIHTALGSISVKGVVVTANLGWHTRVDGSQALGVVSVRLDGSISGTGVLKPQFILDKVKKMAINCMNDQVNKMLNKPAIQESLQK